MQSVPPIQRIPGIRSRASCGQSTTQSIQTTELTHMAGVGHSHVVRVHVGCGDGDSSVVAGVAARREGGEGAREGGVDDTEKLPSIYRVSQDNGVHR